MTKSIDPWVRIQELENQVGELAALVANIRMERTRLVERVDQTLHKVELNLKNFASLSSYPLVDPANPEPTVKPKR